jgi:hypothetical protein
MLPGGRFLRAVSIRCLLGGMVAGLTGLCMHGWHGSVTTSTRVSRLMRLQHQQQQGVENEVGTDKVM